MKKIVGTFIMLAVAITLVGCGNKADSAKSEQSDTARQTSIKKAASKARLAKLKAKNASLKRQASESAEKAASASAANTSSVAQAAAASVAAASSATQAEAASVAAADRTAQASTAASTTTAENNNGPTTHERAEQVRQIMATNQGLSASVLSTIPDDEILAANVGNATNSAIAQTAANLVDQYPELRP